MSILKAVERGVKAAKQTFEPRKYQAAGKPVHCSQCGGDIFEISRRPGTSFTGFALECSNCSHL